MPRYSCVHAKTPAAQGASLCAISVDSIVHSDGGGEGGGRENRPSTPKEAGATAKRVRSGSNGSSAKPLREMRGHRSTVGNV